jgi:NADPH:quinone reductase-like Zn-dependent oxidoreductase
MRAARLHELGGLPRVDEIDKPSGDLIAAVTASALNPVDISIGKGTFYGGTPERPYVIGSEAVGVLPDGRRIWLRSRGSMAERAAVSPDAFVEVPEGVDDVSALACGTAGLTGWLAVSWRAQVTAGDTVLVLGASGSVGAAAVQGAKLLGATRVIGAARRVDLIPDAADEAIALDAELPEADVIVDAVWGEPAERALAVAAHGVRFVQLGQSAGPAATLQSAWVRGKVANILGLSLFSTPPSVLVSEYLELCGHVRDGRIAFTTEAYELERVAEAWERQASGSPGAKVVVSFG